MILQKKVKRQGLPKWKWSGLLGTVVGFSFLILAPGNFARSEHFHDNTFIIIKLLKRIIENTQSFIDYLLPLMIVLIILVTIIIYHKKKIKYEFYLYLLGTILSIYAMCLSPIFPPRSWFGIVVFMIISIMTLLFDVLTFHRIYQFILVDFVLVLFILSARDYVITVRDVNDFSRVWRDRVSYIESEKKKGNSEIVVPYYTNTTNSKSPNFNDVDISSVKDAWPNPDIAKYFNIKSIRSVLSES